MAKHLITFGHSPTGDSGATYGSHTEAKTIRLLKPYLIKWSKKSKDSFSFYQGDLFAHRAMSQQTRFDTVTELHLDSPQGNGGHVIINKSYKQDALDRRLRDLVKKHFGIVGYLQSAGGFSYRNNLYNINQAKDKGINYRLVEMFFLSNKEDYDHYTNNLDQIAKEIIEAIADSKVGGSAKPTKPSVSKSKPKPQPSKPKPSSKLVVDGYLGRLTIIELQKALGTYADGILSSPSNVVKELQRLVGARVDGYLGKESYSKLQAYLGTPVDGELWKPSAMIKELQRRLNAGTIKRGKSISAMAKEVLSNTKIPTGVKARAKYFGVSIPTMDKVQNEVNRLMK